MSLSHAYAQVIREKGEDAGYLKKLTAFMTSRGHVGLLPEIVRILSRDSKQGGAEVVLARTKDESKFSIEIREALASLGAVDSATVIDPDIVGGYTVRGKSKVIDKSYRSALVSIYQRTIS